MKLEKLAALLTGISLFAPAAWARSTGGDMSEELLSFMGTYRLAEHRYGHCPSMMVIGIGRDASSVRAGPYEFRGVGMGKMRVSDGNWDGWVETEVGRRGVESKSERRNRHDGTWVREEVEAELDDGLVEIEYERDVRSYRNKEKVRNKCYYAKVDDGVGIPDGRDLPDQGKGGQDGGRQGKGPIGK